MRKVGHMKGMPTKLMAMGTLLGTLAAIGNGDRDSIWGRAMAGLELYSPNKRFPCVGKGIP